MVIKSSLIKAFDDNKVKRFSLKLNYPKEKNININYFVRELRNIFESGNKIEIPNEIICELVSLIFDKQMDDTQLNNILKNSNKNISNTSYTLQFTTKENNIEEREYIKTKNCL